jgi:hypothetical protein
LEQGNTAKNKTRRKKLNTTAARTQNANGSGRRRPPSRGDDLEKGRAQAQNEAKVYFKKMPPIALRTQILRELAKRLGITQLELEQFYGIASVEVNNFTGRSSSVPGVGALETLKKLPKKLLTKCLIKMKIQKNLVAL